MAEDTTTHPLDGMESQVTAWRTAYANIFRWKMRANRARRRITEALDSAGASVGTLRGEPAVRLEPAHRDRLDVARLRAERPDVYAEYATSNPKPRLWDVEYSPYSPGPKDGAG